MTLPAAVLVLVVGAAAMANPGSSATGDDCVILLHGMARTASSMQRMAESLADAGYVVANTDYPSREHRIETLAPMAIEAGLAECERQGAGGRKHFVTHSLGGILVRYADANGGIPGLGRVVMLGPPNQGSAAADQWRGFPGFGWLNGPAGYQLGKGDDSLPRQLGAVSFELGVIAGDRSIDPITSMMLDNPDDGRVSVADTRVEGMQDFRQVHATHAFMMRNREVIRLTLGFLANGRFPGNGIDPQ